MGPARSPRQAVSQPGIFGRVFTVPGVVDTQPGSFSSQSTRCSVFSGVGGAQERRAEAGRRLAGGVTGSPCSAWGHLGVRATSPASREVLRVQAAGTAGLAPASHQPSCPGSPPLLRPASPDVPGPSGSWAGLGVRGEPGPPLVAPPPPHSSKSTTFQLSGVLSPLPLTHQPSIF